MRKFTDEEVYMKVMKARSHFRSAQKMAHRIPHKCRCDQTEMHREQIRGIWKLTAAGLREMAPLLLTGDRLEKSPTEARTHAHPRID